MAAAPNLTTEPSVLVSQVAATGGSRELVGNKGWWWPWPWGDKARGDQRGFPIIGTGCYEGEDKQAATVTPGVC